MYTTHREYSKMSPEQKKIVSWYGSKTDPRMIHQQNLSERMLVSYKFHENGRISFLKWAKFLGKVNAKKKQLVLLYCRWG